jgi:cold shock CspA family protein
MEPRVEGTITKYSTEKGYGFISCPGQVDVFCHASEVSGARWLLEGDRVSFSVIQTERGMRAVDVRLVDAP